MKDWFHRLSYLAFRVVFRALGLLPIELVDLLGSAFGLAAWVVLPGYRKLALRNVRIAFAGEKSEVEMRALVRRSFSMFGANLLCAVRVAALPDGEVERLCEVEADETLRAIGRSSRPAVVCPLHLGNWEMVAQINLWRTWPRSAAIYQALRNPYLDRWVRSLRSARKAELMDRAEGFRQAGELLREGGCIGILSDQHAGDKGAWVPYFGRLASTTTLPALLARRADALLFCVAAVRTGRARWKLISSEPIEPGNRSAEDLTALLNLEMEKLVRREPDQWFWLHQRWKTPHPEFLLRNYRRGVHVPPGAPLKPFRILVRSTNWLGDAVMTVPAVRAMKAGRPDAHLTVLCKPSLVDFWRLIPEVDVVETIRGSVFSVARTLRRGAYDAAVVLPNSSRSGLEVWLAGIPRRVGCPGNRRKRLLNQLVVPRKGKVAVPPKHQSEHYLEIARSIGAGERPPEWPVPLRMDLLPPPTTPKNAIQIAVCAGAEYGPAKRWPVERFAEVITKLSERRSCEWYLVGTARDSGVTSQIAALAKGTVHDLAGRTTLLELAAKLRDCQALLTNDTGSMHFGALLGVPVVALFGSTEPRLTGPPGRAATVIRHQVECSPCFLRDCPIDFRCMKAIEVDEVVEALLRSLST